MKKITAALFSFCMLTAFFSCSRKEAANHVTAAFYDLDEEICAVLESEITESAKAKGIECEFKRLEASKKLNASDFEKYGIVFIQNGKSAELLSEKACDIPSACFSVIPSSLTHDKKILPLLLDHYGLAYYSTPQNKLELSMPESYSELKAFLGAEKKSELVNHALNCAGKNDAELFGFISAVALTLYDNEKYLLLAEEISKTDGTELPQNLTLVLDEIIELQKNDFVNKSWYSVSLKDVLTWYFPERNTGVFFLSLSLQRKVDNLYSRYYERADFPPAGDSQKTALIGNEICALSFNDKPAVSQIMEALVSADVQQNLTDRTYLAPVNKSCPAYDKEADDLRYWTAVCPEGMYAPLGSLAFSDKEKQAALAKKIREYLKNSVR